MESVEDRAPATGGARGDARLRRARSEGAFAVGLFVNASLALGKLGVGSIAGSPSLLADGAHSLSDVLTNGGAWLSHRVAKSPPDEDHHYGHGNFESLAALVIGVVLTLGGVGILWGAVRAGDTVLGGREAAFAIGAAVVSILANLWLVRVTLRGARELGSPALRALARDNGTDVLSSGLVVLGAGASAAGLGWAEPLAAAAIGLLVAVLGLRSAREGLDVLMDRVSDRELRPRIRALVQAEPGVLGIADIRVHPLGNEVRVELDLALDGRLSLDEAHRIVTAVEQRLCAAEPSVHEVRVGLRPAGSSPTHGQTKATSTPR